MEKRRIEILAPAGSYASFKAAINAGADAVVRNLEQEHMRIILQKKS